MGKRVEGRLSLQSARGSARTVVQDGAVPASLAVPFEVAATLAAASGIVDLGRKNYRAFLRRQSRPGSLSQVNYPAAGYLFQIKQARPVGVQG